MDEWWIVSVFASSTLSSTKTADDACLLQKGGRREGEWRACDLRKNGKEKEN